MQKVIFITGASSGIGAATVKLFSECGWRVAATMRNPERSEALASLPGVTLHRLDVTDETSIGSAFEEVMQVHGGIDVLVNNAGYGMVGPFEASSAEQVERQFATNVLGLMNVVRQFLPQMRRSGGTIINISSVGGRLTFPLYSVYHASKWAVEGFTESLQFELEPQGIRVKLVEPGPIKTDFYDRSRDLVAKDGLTVYDEFVRTAMANMGKEAASAPGPELVAKTILKAANDKSSRLRYPVNAEAMLTLRKLLPEPALFGLIRAIVLRKTK